MLYPPCLKVGSKIEAEDGRRFDVKAERSTAALGLRELHIVSTSEESFRTGSKTVPVVDEWVWQWSLVRGRVLPKETPEAKAASRAK